MSKINSSLQDDYKRSNIRFLRYPTGWKRTEAYGLAGVRCATYFRFYFAYQMLETPASVAQGMNQGYKHKM